LTVYFDVMIDDPQPEECGLPVIDEPGTGWHDECAKCGTVVV
jgi:hypothetical protein